MQTNSAASHARWEDAIGPRWASRAALCVIGATVASCTASAPPEFDLLGLRPNTVGPDAATAATIDGREFYNSVKVDLDDDRAPTIRRGWTVTVADIKLPDPAYRIDRNALAVTLPAGLPIGLHDVTVTDPGGRSRVLWDALTVLGDSMAEASGGAGGAPSNVLDAPAGAGVGGLGGAAGAAGAAGQSGTTMSSCDDGIRNQDETAVDCGDPLCPPCDCVEATFSDPEPIIFSNTVWLETGAQYWSPTLSADGLTVFFAVSSNALERIYQARRPSTDSITFSGASAVFPNATDNRGTPALSYDGLTLYFFSEVIGGAGGRDLWYATRSDEGSTFGEPVWMPELNTALNAHLPWPARDELTLYYVAPAATDPADSDIWVTQRASVKDAFSAGTNLSELNTTGREERAALTPDGNVLYFSSDREGSGNLDLWVSVRSDTGAFAAPARIAELSTTGEDMDLTLSADSTEIFFASDRTGSSVLYRSRRQCN